MLAMTIAVVAAIPSAQAQTFTVLHRFKGTDGETPYAGLVRDKAGNLYGTTFEGGDLSCTNGFNSDGCGVVFKVSKGGKEAVLHTFEGGSDGENPNATLILDVMGNLYGTTVFGGVNVGGTLFKLDTADKETLLHTFNTGADGVYPLAGVIMDAKGNLYGTTERGGDFDEGTVFKLDNSGSESVLYSFAEPPDGSQPFAGLVRDAKGNLFGTTYRGGRSTSPSGLVFKVNKTGKETVLHNFKNNGHGGFPEAGLILDAAGNLYGTTSEGGKGPCINIGGSGCGVVFKLDDAHKETVLYAFTGGADGANPDAALVSDAQGNFYGTTYNGGSGNCSDDRNPGCGVVFKLDTTGKETVLYSFTGGTGGAHPYAGVLLDAKGNIYGTTVAGGNTNCHAPSGCGVVFKFTPQ